MRCAPLRGLVPVCLAWMAGHEPARAEEFFPTRDENPLLRGFYLPLATDSRLGDGAVLTAAFSVMNTVDYEARGTQQLLIDGESDTLRLMYETTPADAWRVRLTVPLMHDSGGVLDGPIDAWHRFFGFSQGSRPLFPKNALLYSTSVSGRVVDAAQTGFGNLSTEAGWYAADGADRTVSLWAGLSAPTGSAARLTGDGAWDGAIWAHLAHRGSRWRWAVEGGLTQPFGDQIYEGAAHRPVEFLRGALTRDLGASWSLRAQLDGRTGRDPGPDLRLLGPSLQLTVGAAHTLGNAARLEFGFAEDAAVNTAPDITFFIAVRD